MTTADVEFKQNLIDTNGIETKSKELVCRAYNPKKYPVKWYKDGVEINFNDRISTKEAEGSLFLIIKSLEMEDEGVYSCRIGNHQTKGRLGVGISATTRQEVYLTRVGAVFIKNSVVILGD